MVWFQISFLIAAVVSVRAALPSFDFTAHAAAVEWRALHDSALKVRPEGLEISIQGADPFIAGPARDYPGGEQLWMRLAVESEMGGMAQLFYFTHGPSEDKSVRFYVPAGDAEVRVALPALGPGMHLRLDPPGRKGACLLRSIHFEPRPRLQRPAWTPATPQTIPNNAPAVKAGNLSVRQSPEAFGSAEFRVRGELMAAGRAGLPFSYMDGTNTVWLELTNRPVISARGGGLHIEASMIDPGGAAWNFERNFQPAADGRGIEVRSSVTVSADRPVVFLPMIALFPGVGAFGPNKAQALFAGVEYLANEPSSSEADVIGPGALRRVPDDLKITFPLMAISDGARYIALSWERRTDLAAVFDSPDRVFGSAGHLMALAFPGSAPEVRSDGEVLPYGGVMLKAGKTLGMRATVFGGAGATIVPAVQDYVAKNGWPELPKTFSEPDYLHLTAESWLDSEIRDGPRFRHAVGSNFGSQPAADAAMLLQWLSARTGDADLKERLEKTARAAIAEVPPASLNSAAVGHIRTPAPVLVFGRVLENCARAADEARSLLTRFEADGTIRFEKPAKGPDLGRTQPSREANGLTATMAATLLERAAFAGDAELIHAALREVRALKEKFPHDVPRGAQTWEVPLHTPDILASAYLVRAYTLAYELTGERDFLEEARYWAWTGVPFIYLSAPNQKEVGAYSTIAVLGATQWVAPLWIGLPVQWCGMVYAHAIRRLARFDDSAPWARVANGIALAGIQQTHPREDSGIAGLLPDSFDLRNQVRNPVPINPATLQVDAIEAYGEDPLYDFHAFRAPNLLVHAAGKIDSARQSSNEVAFTVRPWAAGSYLLLAGLRAKPSLELNGAKVTSEEGGDFEQGGGRIVIKLRGKSELKLRF